MSSERACGVCGGPLPDGRAQGGFMTLHGAVETCSGECWAKGTQALPRPVTITEAEAHAGPRGEVVMSELRTRTNAEIEAMLLEGDAWLAAHSGPNPAALDCPPHPLAGLPLEMLDVEAETTFDPDVEDLTVHGWPRGRWEIGL